MTADPFAGDPGAVGKLSTALADHQDDIRHGATKVARTADDADDWTGASKDRFTATVSTIPPAAQRVIGRLDAAIDVLDTYADTVRQIQDEAEQIRASQLTTAIDTAANVLALSTATTAASAKDATEADGRRAQRLRSDADDLAATAERLQGEWDALVERRAAADRAAASGLSDTDVLGVAPSYAGSLGAMSDADFLAAVAGMPPEVLAAQDRSVADRLAGMPPETVQAWWDGLGGRGSAGEHSAAQDALITALPAVIGNLNGVPYWARDQANRLAAQRAEATAYKKLQQAKRDRDRSLGGPRALQTQVALNKAQKLYDALRNFNAGARTALNLVHPLPRQIVSFHPGEPPLGAFAVGDLDTAESVSYLVPGMGNSLATTTENMRVASNIQAYQQNADASPTAMVTWLGYEAPPDAKTGDLSVLGDEHAIRGAPNLAADLLGMRATRPEAQINVVAHSYGSTLASIAVAAHPEIHVHSLVTLGSAGIPTTVPDAAATNAAHMYSAQADERGNVAWFGRTFSISRRVDPTDNFGATVMATDGAATVNLHDLAARPGTDDHGYLDVGTKTLSKTAKVTLP
ncbi:alpha/beta hydrolase [Curtobacterium luteum]|uniref:DUF1023 domain-containing protein n=1 Tax=Curtobacterium luteum TaxID=33881 RepID=A0A175RMJ0_9MICO|nr:alpha/beta hydrolase [Curtobacterium luteum]KTR04593.1 hypothetical protein NS184_11610 [Curtobacterium luteum]